MDMPVMFNCDVESLTVKVKLGEVPVRRQRRHGPWIRIARLLGQAAPVDRSAVKPGRGAGLQSRHRQIGGA